MAGEGRVAPLAIHLVRPEHERSVDGHALGLVGGECVSVVEVPAVDVVAREGELVALVGASRDRSLLEVDGGDRGEGAVGDAQAAVVALCNHAVS